MIEPTAAQSAILRTMVEHDFAIHRTQTLTYIFKDRHGLTVPRIFACRSTRAASLQWKRKPAEAFAAR